MEWVPNKSEIESWIFCANCIGVLPPELIAMITSYLGKWRCSACKEAPHAKTRGDMYRCYLKSLKLCMEECAAEENRLQIEMLKDIHAYQKRFLESQLK